MPNPTAALLVIGSEILSGRTVDVNINHIATRLAQQGLTLSEVRIVPDVESTLTTTLTQLRTSYDWLFTTGGIGPTHDDITTACVAASLGLPVERNKAVEHAFLTGPFAARVTPATLRMADFPQGAQLLHQSESLAPGYIVGNIVVMAGVPRVMQAMLEVALPMLPVGLPTYSHSTDVWIAESQIAEGLAAIAAQFPQLDVGSYPFHIQGRHGTSLVVRGTDAEAAQQAHTAIQSLVTRLGAPLATPPETSTAA